MIINCNIYQIKTLTMFRCSISSEGANLDRLQKIYPWIPNSQQIRPCSPKIKEKEGLLLVISQMYNSYEDYIYEFIFQFKTKLRDHKFYVPKENVKNKCVFIENNYPYQVPENCNHYILWFSYEPKSELEINSEINKGLSKLLNHDNYNFIWYINPKKTISKSYHYQVFWTLCYH